MFFKDDNGNRVGNGNIIKFSYGIPVVSVEAKISQKNGKLIGYCPEHNPPEFNLRTLRKYVGSWYKADI